MRRRRAEKRTVIPDPKYKNATVSRFINVIMKEGKKAVAKLESEEERREFLKDLGIEEPAINLLTRSCIKALNLISFFTLYNVTLDTASGSLGRIQP